MHPAFLSDCLLSNTLNAAACTVPSHDLCTFIWHNWHSSVPRYFACLLSGTGTLESRGATVPVHVWSLDNAHPGGGGRIAVWQCLPLSAAEKRVAEHRTSGLTKVDELRAFDGVINVSEGPPAGHGATPGTVEYYNALTTIFIVR